jgi:5S rRNA maturation endonuclease (ribonuclease M5)
MGHFSRDRADDIYEIVAGRQIEILSALGIQWNPARPKQHIRCPYPGHRDDHPSWRWDHDKGMAHCTCGHTNIFGVVERVRGGDWRAARDYCREVLHAAPWQSELSEKPRPDLHVVPLGETSPPWQRPIATTFDYANEDGEVLYQSVKFADGLEPRFMQRHHNGQGGWKWGIDGIRRILYRLPQLIEAVAAGEVVFVVEGEKDADNISELGFAATTNPMGANKWRSEYSEFLRGADVVIVSDNDAAGRKHVEQVAAFLNGIAKRARKLDIAKCWPACPDKGDVSDWIAAGGTVDKLKAIVEPLPDWRQPATESDGDKHADQWPVMDNDAYHGLAGYVVHTIEPQTEAHPVAILLQFLAAFGNAVGRAPHYLIEADKHAPNLFVVLAGPTSKARKGTSEGRVREIMKIADEAWAGEHIKGGLASGEGLIWNVRDAIMKWNTKYKVFEQVDPGVTDKRLLLIEPEFTQTLAVLQRPGNTLSHLIRQAWDGRKLSSLTKNDPACATDAHISIVGHVTDDDLRMNLDATSMANGYANRFLFASVRRVKDLPHGGSLNASTVQEIGKRVGAAIENARNVGRVCMTEVAAKHWEAVYHDLSEGQPGLLGAIIGRAEAQVIRLALIYALLGTDDDSGIRSLGRTDQSHVRIEIEHLKAALAVWEYCETSARQIFGNLLGNPVADEILRALQQAGPTGLTRKQISHGLFSRNRSAGQVQFALDLLSEAGKARCTHRKTDGAGRPAEIWTVATEG